MQITAIYFDQDTNAPHNGGVKDEWIVLESSSNSSTKGWLLNAGDPTQNYRLPDTLFKKLTIYTKRSPTLNTSTIMGLGLGNWIWNNSDPDYAYLYDKDSNLVDAMTYDPD